jgi:hypothetical protein
VTKADKHVKAILDVWLAQIDEDHDRAMDWWLAVEDTASYDDGAREGVIRACRIKARLLNTLRNEVIGLVCKMEGK